MSTCFVFALFKRFPANSNWRQQWIVKLRRVDEGGRLWQPGKDAAICSEHFYESDFYFQFARKLVKPGVVPTVFSFAPPVVKRKLPKSRQTDAAAAVSSQKAPLSIAKLPGGEGVLLCRSDKSGESELEIMSTADENVSTVQAASSLKSFHSYALPSPTKLKHRTDVLHKALQRKIQVLKNTRRREYRLRGKVSNLLCELKRRQLISEKASELLESYKDMPLTVLTGKVNGCFTDEQRQFAGTLHYYSPAAYSFVRSRFKSMPHPRTIRRWMSAFNGQPGLTEESFNAIAAENLSSDSKYKICALTMDEMEIKKRIDRDKTGKLYGFIDLGCGPLDDDSHPQATKVLVVLAIGINGHWKLPLAYYLTNGADADLQASILNDVLRKLWDCGCLAVSVTFDGLPANQKTLAQLGGSLEIGNMKSLFPHPCDSNVSVAVIFDACHMLKLARNLFNEYQIINIPGVGKAKWRHIEMLQDKQSQEGLTLANKLTKQHVHFKTQKMKVRLAVQVLSSSCANALEFLRVNGYSDFMDTAPTELLLLQLDKLFDILNCRSAFGKGYKSPMNASNLSSRVKYLMEMKSFLLSLEDSNGKKLYQTKRRTCILGFIASIDSTIHLANSLLNSTSGVNGVHLKYLLTYKTSQDHVEMFFSTIRRRGGWNNNPTAYQFVHIYRAILSKVGAVPSCAGNVNVLDYDSSEISQDNADVDKMMFSNCLVDHTYYSRIPLLSHYVENVCAYIAGFIVRRLLPKLRCTECREHLVDEANSSNCGLIELKNNGGLIKPSAGVVYVVQAAEQNIRLLVSKESPAHSLSRLGLQLQSAVLRDIDIDKAFDHSKHALESADGLDNHVITLIRKIVAYYIDIRKFHIIKSWNIDQLGTCVRQMMNKNVLFKNQ